LGIIFGCIILLFLRIFLIECLLYLASSKLTVKKRIYNILISKEQAKRESHWLWGFFVESLMISVILYYLYPKIPAFSLEGFWLLFGIYFLVLEPLYYFYHVLLHTPYFYKHHHRVHHLSVVTRPTTSVTFTILERLSYSIFFNIAIFVAAYMHQASLALIIFYILLFDFVNYMGHFNFEFFPKWYNKSPLKWILYSPTYHSQHHSRFNKNLALFCPFWDLIFGTYEKDTTKVFDLAIEGKGPKKLSKLDT